MKINIQYLREEIDSYMLKLSSRTVDYFEKFRGNLLGAIDHYGKLAEEYIRSLFKSYDIEPYQGEYFQEDGTGQGFPRPGIVQPLSRVLAFTFGERTEDNVEVLQPLQDRNKAPPQTSG